MLPVLLLLGLAGGCATSHAPRTWLQLPQQQQFAVCGAWAEIETSIDSVVQLNQGELIAVTADSLFITTPFGPAVFARTRITGVTLVHYRAQHPVLAGWSTVGALSTLTHGWALIGTLPLWVITGIACTAKASGEPFVHYKPGERKDLKYVNAESARDMIEKEWRDLGRFARFPQGMPESIDRSLIRQFEPPETGSHSGQR